MVYQFVSREDPSLIYFHYMRIESLVKLVLELKSAADFLAPYIYDNGFDPSSPITAKSRMRD